MTAVQNGSLCWCFRSTIMDCTEHCPGVPALFKALIVLLRNFYHSWLAAKTAIQGFTGKRSRSTTYLKNKGSSMVICNIDQEHFFLLYRVLELAVVKKTFLMLHL